MKFAAAALVLFAVFCCLEGALGYSGQREHRLGKVYDRPNVHTTHRERQQGELSDRPNAHTSANAHTSQRNYNYIDMSPINDSFVYSYPIGILLPGQR